MHDETINYLKINLLLNFRWFNWPINGLITHIIKKLIKLLTLREDGFIVKHKVKYNLMLNYMFCSIRLIEYILLRAGGHNL
jgi:hypothetical protein